MHPVVRNMLPYNILQNECREVDLCTAIYTIIPRFANVCFTMQLGNDLQLKSICCLKAF